MTLEEALREAAAKGLTHLSVWPVHSQDRKTVYWHAQATPSTMHKYITTNSLDPVEAVMEVLKALPKAPKRTAKEVTATVTEPDISHAEPFGRIDKPHPGPEPAPPTLSLEQWK